MSKLPINCQVGGDHYKKLGKYQPVEVLRHWLTPEEFRGWVKGDAIVYLCREGAKGGDEDLAKAVHTLQMFHQLKGDEVMACPIPVKEVPAPGPEVAQAMKAINFLRDGVPTLQSGG